MRCPRKCPLVLSTGIFRGKEVLKQKRWKIFAKCFFWWGASKEDTKYYFLLNAKTLDSHGPGVLTTCGSDHLTH